MECPLDELRTFAEHINEVLRSHPRVVQTESEIVNWIVKGRDLAEHFYVERISKPAARA